MHPIKLGRTVTVQHPSFLGCPAEIVFTPSIRQEWCWQPPKQEALVIDASRVQYRQRRLRLTSGRASCEVYEHLGALRFFGLLGLTFRTNRRVPHFGRALDAWTHLKPVCLRDESVSLPWYTVAEPVRWEYPGLRNGERGFTAIYPATAPTLKLDIDFGYRGIGDAHQQFVLPNDELLEELCAVGAQGFPPELYHISRIASLLGWPHHRNFTWPQEGSKVQVLERFGQHRALDLLGALSLLCRDGLFAGHVISNYSGHRADLEVVQRADPHLVRLA